MSGTCRVTLLGRFAVEVRGQLVPASAWHHDGERLVKLLALQPTHRLTRGEIVAQLWPRDKARAAAHRLEKAAGAACKAMGDRLAVTLDDDVLRLWPTGALEVDLLRFLVVTKHVGSERGAREALALYGGELLPDDHDEPWTASPRRRAREANLRLLARTGQLPGVIDLDHSENVLLRLQALRPQGDQRALGQG